MPRFFIEDIGEDNILISGNEADHISKSLRMKKGDEITVCDTKGNDYFCVIENISNDVTLKILRKEKSKTEPDVNVTIYQAMPKLDKLETIVQICVELGAVRIVPVLTKRCISRPDEKNMKKKIERLSKISLEAAKQSGRGIIPVVEEMVSFKTAVDRMKEDDIGIILYEGGGKSLSDISFYKDQNISVLIGSEGGFDEDEVEYAVNNGIERVGLGERILRCETAPIASLAIIMHLTKNM